MAALFLSFSTRQRLDNLPPAEPCPFCGSEDVWLMEPADEDGRWSAQCRGCHADGPFMAQRHGAAQAAYAWNHRGCPMPVAETRPRVALRIVT
ncbi:MAG: Lar family restriction alleviation protein [Vicinamibacterales bacterium]